MRIRSSRLHALRGVLFVCGLLLCGGLALADAPAGYYDTVDASSTANLRSTLHGVIDDHLKIPYTAAGLDTWDVLESADEDPNDPTHILDIYMNASYQKWGAGNLDYNREHSWPKSFGFPNDGSDNYPYTDCHQLFLANDSYNSARNNKPYGTVGGVGTTEYTTVVNDGVGGGSGVYPGWSSWANPTYWETWVDRRGDVARALFYMDVRYEGGSHGITGVTEPDLILTDNLALIEASNTGSNLTVAYMGLLSVLLQWHQQDPPDDNEMHRNDAVFASQGNRNPFIDHPEWIDCIFVGGCGGIDVTAPAVPVSLVGAPGDGTVNLNWADNGEIDLAGYTVYRSETQGGPYVPIPGALLPTSQYADSGLTNGVAYHYVVTASDLTGNESAYSFEVSVTPFAGAGNGGLVWINEFHYDNEGTDTGEFFEIAGAAGTSLAGWKVVGYNGNGGATYATVNLTGTLPDQQGGCGTLSFAMVGMQNGSPDALALVDNTGSVIELISYEGVLTAADGPAVGLQSTDVVVVEDGTTPIGYSLQLIGTGHTRGDFTWAAIQPETAGAVNTGQTFVGTSAALDLPGARGVAITSAYPNPFNPATTIAWAITEPGPVRVQVFSLKGELVRTLVDQDHAAGEYEVRWNGTGSDGRVVPSGAYFCRIVSGSGIDTRPLLLLK